MAAFLYSLSMPYFNNVDAIETFVSQKEDSPGVDSSAKTDYYKLIDAHRTSRLSYMNPGASLAIGSISIWAFLVLAKVRRFSDLIKLRTLTRPELITCANVVWVLLVPCTIWHYSLLQARGEFPPWADTIAIPIFYQSVGLILLMIPLNIFLFIATIKSSLPTRLFKIPSRYNAKEIIKEIFWFCTLQAIFYALILLVIDGDFGAVPVVLYLMYVALNLRAGQIKNGRCSPPGRTA